METTKTLKHHVSTISTVGQNAQANAANIGGEGCGHQDRLVIYCSTRKFTLPDTGGFRALIHTSPTLSSHKNQIQKQHVLLQAQEAHSYTMEVSKHQGHPNTMRSLIQAHENGTQKKQSYNQRVTTNNTSRTIWAFIKVGAVLQEG